MTPTRRARFILRIVETDGPEEEAYVSTDDEETVNAVFEIFKEKFKDQFKFADEAKSAPQKICGALFVIVLSAPGSPG